MTHFSLQKCADSTLIFFWCNSRQNLQKRCFQLLLNASEVLRSAVISMGKLTYLLSIKSKVKVTRRNFFRCSW